MTKCADPCMNNEQLHAALSRAEQGNSLQQSFAMESLTAAASSVGMGVVRPCLHA